MAKENGINFTTTFNTIIKVIITLLIAVIAFFAKDSYSSMKDADKIQVKMIENNTVEIKKVSNRLSGLETENARMDEKYKNIEKLLEEIRSDVKDIKKK